MHPGPRVGGLARLCMMEGYAGAVGRLATPGVLAGTAAALPWLPEPTHLRAAAAERARQRHINFDVHAEKFVLQVDVVWGLFAGLAGRAHPSRPPPLGTELRLARVRERTARSGVAGGSTS